MRTEQTLFGVPCVPGAWDMAVLGGAGGHFVSWGPVLSVRDPTDKKTVLAITRRHRGVFGNVLAHRNRVRVAQISYYDDVEGCHPSF